MPDGHVLVPGENAQTPTLAAPVRSTAEYQTSSDVTHFLYFARFGGNFNSNAISLITTTNA